MKRASIGIALLISGFLAGLVLTGRLRSADESTAQTGARARARQLSPRRQPPQHAAASPISPASPRRPSKASSTSRRCRSFAVRTRRSPTIPFFEYFFGGREDIFGSRDQLARSLGSGVLISEDGYVVTNSHVIGSAKAEVTVIFARQARGAGAHHRHRQGDGSGARQSRQGVAAAAEVGRLVEGEGGRVGARHRQPVSAQPQRLARHHQRARPQEPGILRVRGLHSDRRRDQPRQLGRRARQRARRAHRHQHRHLQLEPERRLPRASASPSRATSRAG